MPRIDFKTDILKHYVRKYGWLPACQQQLANVKRKRHINKFPLRYFTFCASEAIDVFMLEREGILRRSGETGRLQDVYFCEMEAEDFGIIADLIGSPEQGFLGEFEKIVLFEDDDETEGRTIEDDEPYSLSLRKKLRYKDAYLRLKDAIPFDIINLDVFGVMFPPKQQDVIAPLLKSIFRILEWQTEAALGNRLFSEFTLLLTSHIDPDITDAGAIEQLRNRLVENLETNADFQAAFLGRYGHDQVEKFLNENFAEFFCLSLPKFIIYRTLFQLGWKVSYGPTYLYNRDDRYVENKKYQIMHSVSIYERIPNFGERLDDPVVGEYARSINKIINEGASWVDSFIEDLKVKEYLSQDLSDIVRFRDQYR